MTDFEVRSLHRLAGRKAGLRIVKLAESSNPALPGQIGPGRCGLRAPSSSAKDLLKAPPEAESSAIELRWKEAFRRDGGGDGLKQLQVDPDQVVSAVVEGGLNPFLLQEDSNARQGGLNEARGVAPAGQPELFEGRVELRVDLLSEGGALLLAEAGSLNVSWPDQRLPQVRERREKSAASSSVSAQIFRGWFFAPGNEKVDERGNGRAGEHARRLLERVSDRAQRQAPVRENMDSQHGLEARRNEALHVRGQPQGRHQDQDRIEQPPSRPVRDPLEEDLL